jgi:hypothetical protein
MIVSISCFAKDYQLEMMFPRELKIKRSTLKIKCNDVVGYKYYHIRGRFISIPVVDNKGNMIKCK